MQLILRKANSPYGDITKNSVLSQEELDLNQIKLKGEIIYTADTENNTIVFKKINGDEIIVPVSEAFDQNNLVKSKYLGIYYKDAKPSVSATTLTELFNRNTLQVEDDEIWLLDVVELVADIVLINNDGPQGQVATPPRFVQRRYIFGNGSGEYDPIPSQIDEDIFLINEGGVTSDLIITITGGANTQTFDLGNITGEGDFWTYMNDNGVYDMTDPTKEFLILFVQDDITYLYLFIGELGVYGDGEEQSVEGDFILITSSEVTASSLVPSWQETIDVNRNADRATLYHIAYNGGVFGGYTEFPSQPTVIAQDPVTGRIYYYGYFLTYQGVVRNHIVAALPDGTIDNTFNVGTGFNNWPFTPSRIIIQPDGKTIYVGTFTSYNGTPANRIIRLNTNGSVDNTFVYGTGFNNWTVALGIDSLDRVYVGGNFTQYSGQTGVNRIVRLNPNGSRDLTFIQGTGFNSVVTDLVVDGNDDVYVVGYFSQYSGQTGNNRIIKLLSDGSKDNSFNSGTGLNSATSNAPSRIYLTSDNKVFVIGYFTQYNGQPANKMVKLNLDGSIDTSFQSQGTGFNGTFLSQFFEYQGNYIFSGNFTNYNGTPSQGSIILDTSGNIVRTFPEFVEVKEILNDDRILGLNWDGTSYSVGVLEDNYIVNIKKFNYNETNGKATYEVGGLLSLSAQEIMPKRLIEELISQNSKNLQTLFEESASENMDYAYILMNNSDFLGVNFEKGNVNTYLEGDLVGVFEGFSSTTITSDGVKVYFKDDIDKVFPQGSHLDDKGNITRFYSIINIMNEIPFTKKLEMGNGFGTVIIPDVAGQTETLATEEWVNRNKSFINYFEFSGNAVTTIVASDTWYKLATSGTTSLFSRNDLVHTNNRVTNTGDTKVFKIEGIISISAGNNQEIHAAFFKNDNLYPCSEQSILLSGTGKSSALPFHCLVELEQNDYIEVWVKNATGTTNITLSNVNVIITEM